jgi:hypothetical protein
VHHPVGYSMLCQFCFLSWFCPSHLLTGSPGISEECYRKTKCLRLVYDSNPEVHQQLKSNQQRQLKVTRPTL